MVLAADWELGTWDFVPDFTDSFLCSGVRVGVEGMAGGGIQNSVSDHPGGSPVPQVGPS